MALAKRKVETERKCAFDWCEKRALAKELCSKHYSWELYHWKAEHGYAYFKDYKANHEELMKRADTFSQTAKPANLRRVK